MIQALFDFCQSHPTRAKWVFVPSHALGHTLGERLAREHGVWANVRFVTPLDVAVRMAGPYLLEQGVDPSDETLGPALVMRLLLALPAVHDYFRPMAEQPSMADALWRTLTELRLAGSRYRDVDAVSFASRDKQREIVALLAAYERFLDDHRVADAAIVFSEAHRREGYCPIGSGDVRFEWPETIWPPLVRRFLDALPGPSERWPSLDVPRLDRPRRMRAAPDTGAAASPPVTASAQPERASARLAYLLAPDRGPRTPIADNDTSLQIFHAGGRDAEIDEVCRRVLASGLPLDVVEIACGSDAHALLAWEKCVRLGWPVTISQGIPAAHTRPGRALLAWCDWIENDFAATHLRRLLQSGDVSPRAWRDATDRDGGMSPGQAARLVLRAEAAWGRATYETAFARLRAFYEQRAQSADRGPDERARDLTTLARLNRLDAWVRDALARVPAEHDGHIDVQTHVAGARAFLRENALRASVLDAAALVALDDSLAELEALGSFRTPLSAALRFLRERVTTLRVGVDRARPGALHVSTLKAAGLAGRGLTFVVGLEEGRVFPPAIEDPVLLDAERAAIDPMLARSDNRLTEAVHLVVTRLADTGASAPHGVCLSYSCRDTREFRETFPSWIVLQAYRLLRADPSLGFADLAQWLGEPVSAVPGQPENAITDSGWWLSHAGRATERTASAVLRAFPSLARGRDALSHRESEAFTIWDGHVAAAGPNLDIVRASRAVSPSALENAAACPFRFFLREGLGIEALDEDERQQDAWLDPLMRGRELHEIFAVSMRELRSERRRPRRDIDVARIVRRGSERLQELKRAWPPPSEEVFNAESDDFLEDLRVFIEAECRAPGHEGLAFEVTFGLPIDDAALEPLALPDPVSIPLGPDRTLRVHGRIDRVDRLEDGSIETIDYKTGGYFPEDWEGVFQGGRRLQHALYGVAVEAMLARPSGGVTVARGTYYFPTLRGHGRRREISSPERSQVVEVLRDLTSMLANGLFLQTPESKTCRWCEFSNACGREPWARARQKFAAAGELTLFRELRGHK